jgi:hypothetical protein
MFAGGKIAVDGYGLFGFFVMMLFFKLQEDARRIFCKN